MRNVIRLSIVAVAVWGLRAGAQGGDGAKESPGGRNSVSLTAKGLPASWEVEAGKQKNVKWSADTGDRGYGAPVFAGGKLYVATNNKQPRDKKVTGYRAVLMCFDAATGKFLWQNTHPMAPPEVDQQAKPDGLCSTPTVAGDKVYYVTPGCVVICADAATGKEQWSYDMMKKLDVFPCIINSCSPLVVEDMVYLMTANGVGEDANGNTVVLKPKAPSFVALDAKTGALKWQSNLPGANIIHGQWGSAAYAKVNGKGQVLFPGGDNYLYALDAATGALVWKFRCAPALKGDNPARQNYLVATPVVHENRAYIGVGAAPDTGYGDRVGHFWCIDVTKKGDVSAKEKDGKFDPKDPQNKDSALVWHYGGEINPRPKLGRSVVFGQTISSPAVHDGLVYITEESGYLHCLDAKTGQKQWEYDFKTAIWGSAYWADGKVYVGADDGTVHVFAHGRQLKHLAENDMLDGVQSTPTAAGGVLYVTTKSKVYALGMK